jgi:hypothetical protein
VQYIPPFYFPVSQQIPAKRHESGFVMLTVLIAIVLLGAMISFYSYMTILEGASNRTSTQSNNAFYSAEAGLNTRAEALRQRFTQFERPSGTSPTKASDGTYCLGAAASNGASDFACQSQELNGASVKTYVVDKTAATPVNGVVPPGKINAGLSYQEYTYDLFSSALVDNLPASILQLRFRSRLIPLFQFAIFNQNDLDFSNTATFNITGPVHTNGNMYFSSGGGATTLTLQSSVTAAGSMFRGFKDNSGCGGTVQIVSVVGNPAVEMNCAGSGLRTSVTDAQLATWNSRVRQNVGQLRVPTTDVLSPTSGSVYWDQADLRIAYDVPTNTVSVYQSDGTVDSTLTSQLNTCAAVTSSNTFRDNREQNSATAPTGTVLANMRLLEVNVAGLLNCISSTTGNLGIAGSLANTDQNGLVIHATVRGPNSSLPQSLYGVRLSNGANLQGARGLTFVTDQAVYIQGDYNRTSKIPAAIIADTANILSNNWTSLATRIPTSNLVVNGGFVGGNSVNGPLCPVLNSPTSDAKSQMVLACRPATSTTLNAAIVAGMSITGNANGTAGQDVGLGNGGPNNLVRYHEDWGVNGGLVVGGNTSTTAPATITYLGSLISLGVPTHSTGAFRLGNPTYNPPTRNFSFDTSFKDLANLPPASPNAVYLVQERFVREFER